MNSKMKKLVTTMMGAMLVTITAIAQVTPMVLGDKHAMLRMNEKVSTFYCLYRRRRRSRQ